MILRCVGQSEASHVDQSEASISKVRETCSQGWQREEDVATQSVLYFVESDRNLNFDWRQDFIRMRVFNIQNDEIKFLTHHVFSKNLS